MAGGMQGWVTTLRLSGRHPFVTLKLQVWWVDAVEEETHLSEVSRLKPEICSRIRTTTDSIEICGRVLSIMVPVKICYRRPL